MAEYQFKKITTKDGLSLDNIDCIAQDDEGLLYFGTNGLNIYDGNSIKKFDLSNTKDFGNKIKSIVPISSTKILIGSLDKGLFILDKEFNRIYSVALNHEMNSTNLPILASRLAPIEVS